MLKTSQSYVHLLKHKDGIEDAAIKLASDNIKMAESLEEDLQIYNETVHPHFEEQRDKAKDLVEQLEAKSQTYSRENAVKLLKTASNDKYKQGSLAQKGFNKGNIDKDEFLK